MFYPIKWYCKMLGKWIDVSEDAIFHPEFGWICDCGCWLKEPDIMHPCMVVLFGRGDSYVY